MAKIIMGDDETQPRVELGFIDRIRGHATIDVASTSGGDEGAGGFPWSYAESTKRPIGSLFLTTDAINLEILRDFEERYPMAKRAIRLPVASSFNAGITIRIKDDKTPDKTKKLYDKYELEWKTHFELTRLYGHNDMIYGWRDDQGKWADKEPAETLQYDWLYAMPREYEANLMETDTIPNGIKSLSASFGNTTLNMVPSRFTHSMIKKLCTTDMQGESVLVIMFNLLQIQIHSDWSIGQSLFRRASGLLAMFAPKKNVTESQKSAALGSVANHNAKTALYIPFGWNIKDILKPGGNMAISRTYKIITQQMAAATGIPEKILLGEMSPTDANESDKKIYYDTVDTFRKEIMRPALYDWIRKSQKAGMLSPGEITIEFGELESRNKVDKEKDITQIGAMKLLQARMDLARDKATNQIRGEITEGSPDTQELVNIIIAKK